MIQILHQLEPRQRKPDRDLARQLRDLAAEAGFKAKAAISWRLVNAARAFGRDAAQIGRQAIAAAAVLPCNDCGAPTGGWRPDLCLRCWQDAILSCDEVEP